MEIGSFFEIDPATVRKSGVTEELHLSQVDKYGKNSVASRLPAGKRSSLPWSVWSGECRMCRNAV